MERQRRRWIINTIRGIDVNNIFTVGSYDGVCHYNSFNLKRYEELANPTDRILSVDVKDDMVIASGYRYLNNIDKYDLFIIGRKWKVMLKGKSSINKKIKNTKPTRLIIICLLIFKSLFIGCCSASNSQPKAQLSLSTEDVSCREAWLILT